MLCDVAMSVNEQRDELVKRAALASARASMATFAALMRPKWGRLPDHQRAICDRLDAVASGECKRLILTLPPQHGKSELAARLFPAYYLGRNPDAKIIMASYSHALVSHHSRDAREVMRQALYGAIFPGAALARDAQAVEAWGTEAGGRVIAAGREGGITGHAADLIIADDLIASREEAESPTMLEKVWDFWTSGLISRAHVDTRIVLIGTRWSPGDPTGRVLSGPGAGGWTVLHLTALAEDGDPIGRAVGSPLWPSRHPQELLDSKRLDIGEHEFQSLYQGRPFARGGQYIRRGWFVECSPADVPAATDWTRGLDLAVSTKSTADYTASVMVGRHGSAVFLSGGWHRRAAWPDVKRIVCARAREERVRLAVESVAGFEVAYRELAEELAGVVPVQRVTATRDKLTRALPWIAAAESGRVVIVRSGDAGKDAWIGELLAQCEAFPSGGAHDDLVDAVSIGYQEARSGAYTACAV